jgi:hypothetical protein
LRRLPESKQIATTNLYYVRLCKSVGLPVVESSPEVAPMSGSEVRVNL